MNIETISEIMHSAECQTAVGPQIGSNQCVVTSKLFFEQLF